MENSREKLFELAKKKRKEQKEKEENNSYASFEQVAYTSIGLNTDKVIRIVGNPILARDKGTDPVLSHISMIVGDNGKKFRCIWPSKAKDNSWILWKVYDKIMSYDWDSTNNTKKFHYAESHPTIFKRVAKNNSERQFETGWRPSKFVHLNIIDRHDMEYHRANKHLKVLSKKSSEVGDKIWYEPGVPEFLYTKIWDDIVEYNGDWQNYDIVVRKLDETPWYSAFHCVDDHKKIQADVKDLLSDQPLTEEEITWEGYDFDKLFPITSYTKIKSRLGKFLKIVDLELNTKFSEELESLVEIEEKERPKVETKSTVIPKNTEDDEDVDLDLEPEPEIKAEPTVRTRATVKSENNIPWDKLFDGSFNGKKYLGAETLTDEEKTMVEGINDDGSFKYVKTWKGKEVELLKNPGSNFISPEQFHVDPLSGELFE